MLVVLVPLRQGQCLSPPVVVPTRLAGAIHDRELFTLPLGIDELVGVVPEGDVREASAELQDDGEFYPLVGNLPRVPSANVTD